MDKLLSIKETSEIIGLKIPTIYKYVCCRKIPFIKIGGRVLFDAEKLKAWIQQKSIDPIDAKK